MDVAERNAGAVLPLDTDSFHNVASHLPLSPVIESSGSRIGMTSQVLNIFQSDALTEQVRNRCDST